MYKEVISACLCWIRRLPEILHRGQSEKPDVCTPSSPNCTEGLSLLSGSLMLSSPQTEKGLG